MEELTTWQMIVIIFAFGAVFIFIFRIIIGLGDYLESKANFYKAKTRVLKARYKEIFNKWYD